MSPSIVTETVWALAHEKPPVIPNRIIAVTTTAGREAIRRELFATPSGGTRAVAAERRRDRDAVRPSALPCVWDQLRCALAARGFPLASKLRFGTTADDIRVFTRADARGRSVELEDIRTPADNEAAADFLLDKLREFAENEDVRLICSLAGGRKTMGALLYACLSLVGRETDRLTHVLVNEPFDDPRLQPRFYFPTRPPTLHRANPPPSRVSSAKARIQLADVPFVPLRNLFPRELGRMPGRFMSLVEQYRGIIGQLSEPPRVELSEDEPVVVVEGRPVRLPATAFALLNFLVERARRNEPAFLSFKEAVDSFQGFVRDWAKGHYDFRRDAEEKLTDVEEGTLRKLANTIAVKLRQAGVSPSAIHHLRPHRGQFGIRVQNR